MNRRQEYVDYLNQLAEDNRARILDLGQRADDAFRVGSTLRGADNRRMAAELSEIVAEIETQIDHVRSGALAPARTELGPRDWARVNLDVGDLTPGGVTSDDSSALTGTSGRPPIDHTRHYNTYGGLRPPLAVHQQDLEEAVPRDGNGRPQRLPDPRAGNWFRLANDGGPEADPTRGLNCVDGVLALYDTYMHARPRVSAPRTFDVYAHGNPDRPLGGERNGVRRIGLATGGAFQNLCPYVGKADPQTAKPAIDQAVRNLSNHLHNAGHGAYAFIITDLEQGGSHAWAAMNQNGTILFVDPQVSRVTENTPIYTHHGTPAGANIVSMDALVVDANGTPVPLPFHGPGLWSTTPTGAGPSGANFDSSPEPPQDPTVITDPEERAVFDSLSTEDQETLRDSVRQADLVAARVSADLHAIVSETHSSPSDQTLNVVDERNRVKGLGSLARKYARASETAGTASNDFLSKVPDRVRFSIAIGEDRYGSALTEVLNGLQERGYQVIKTASFWGRHGRHNGFNVDVVTPTGFRLELQVPTPLSRSVGKKTHDFYRIVRLGTRPMTERVNAFLEILATNKASGIYDRRPKELDLLTDAQQVNTTFAKWIGSTPGALKRYKDHLAATGQSFEEVLQEHGLDVADVPGLEGLGLLDDRH